MEVTELNAELTEAEFENYLKKADTLAIRENASKNYGVVSKVHPVVFIEPESKERIVAYLREPSYMTKIKVLDKVVSAGIYTAADELRQATLIEDASDPRAYKEEMQRHEVMLGVVNYCMAMVKTMQNQFKKK